MSCCSFYLVIFATALFYYLELSFAGNNETDQKALLEMKSKITHDPLGVMSSWNDNLPFCTWHGVTCDRVHHRVIALDLQSSNLTGIISPYLGNLSFLRELHIENNNLQGTIPPEIGRLHRLRVMWLVNNSIGGKIPRDISGCSSLVSLYIYRNKLVGDIPFELSLLSDLRYLHLGYNNLTGNIPTSLGNLSSLSKLYLPQSNLVGNIPHSLGNLHNLTEFSLFGNNLVGEVPPSIFNLSLLRILDLGDNGLEGNLPSSLGNMLSYLRFFSIYINQFTGKIPTSLSNASNLELLQLGENHLQGQVPSLHNLQRLTRLHLGSNSLGNGQATDLNFVSTLANATKLQWLIINKNNFGGNFPKIICNFSMLIAIGLNNNNIVGDIPICIERLVRLQFFEANDNALSGFIPQSIGKLQLLSDLFLSGNKLSGNIPLSIGNLTKLTLLSLSNNNLEGQIPSTIGNCKMLLGVDLSKNNLSSSIPLELLSLSSLSISLDLSDNHLSGLLPQEVGLLNNLAGLDLTRNMFSGEIPHTIGQCIALEELYLGRNYFQGAIPDALQMLKGLQVLDLSQNNLSGEIPKFLGSLPLHLLNLSYNSLKGEVPTGGVLSNVTGVSLVGNSMLCGDIPKLKLPRCDLNQNQKRKPVSKRMLILAVLFGVFGVVLLVALFVSIYKFWYQKRSTKPTATSDHDSEKFPNLSYQTLLNATNGFSSENMIGRGTFGVVYKGALHEQEETTTVAIKTFNLEHHGASKSFMAECDVLRNIRHRNLVKVITACSSIDYQGNNFKALVYEYMVNGSLEDWLHPEAIDMIIEDTSNAPRSLNLRQRLDIAVDVASALEYLHHQCGASIVHCDLKPSNVLLDEDMIAHVSDFGLAKFLSKSIITNTHSNQSSSLGVRGTIGYAPPGK